MSFGGFDPGSQPQPMAEINTTPLVDVMLVLLVVFMITAPLLTHALRVDLPPASAPVAAEQPETIRITIDADGVVHWNDEALDGLEALDARLSEAASTQPQPELHLRAERATRYERVAAVISSAQRAGLVRIGLVTDPRSAAPDADRR